jgi:hypothetical protein
MMSAIARFATPEPTVCAVCHRRAVWLGYAPNHKGPVIWLCDDSGCHAAGRKVFRMPPATLDAYEIGAALEAGTEAGTYLEEVGTTDLAQLSPDQWREFLHRLFVGFEQIMRRKILSGEAPF